MSANAKEPTLDTKGATYCMVMDLIGMLVVVVLFGVVRSKTVSKEYELVVVVVG
jgi:hypothetical protein